MPSRKNLRKIRKDSDLLELAQEIKQLHTDCQGKNFFNPEKHWEMKRKISEYRQKLAEKSIINHQEAETLENKTIFLEYVAPPLKKSRITRFLEKFN